MLKSFESCNTHSCVYCVIDECKIQVKLHCGNFTGVNRKNKHSVEYPNVPSAIKPVAHRPWIPIPEPLKDFTVLESLSSTNAEDENAHDLWDEQSCGASSSKQPKFFTQDALNDLSRDLNLSKESVQLLGSRLRDHNL